MKDSLKELFDRAIESTMTGERVCDVSVEWLDGSVTVVPLVRVCGDEWRLGVDA